MIRRRLESGKQIGFAFYGDIKMIQNNSLESYKEYSSNYLNSLARTSIMARISVKALGDFPKNLPKELKESLNEDFKFLKERKKFRQQGFLTVDDYSHFTKDYDSLTRFSILLLLTNQYSLDTLLLMNKSKDKDEIFSELIIRDAFRSEFLENNNVPDRNLTVKDFNAKYGVPNVLTINFSKDNILDYYSDTINYNHQVLAQVLVTCLAQFESFLTRSIKLLIQTTKMFRVITKKQGNSYKKYIVSKSTQSNSQVRILIPNLKRTCLSALYKFVSSKQISLLNNTTPEHRRFFVSMWAIRNLIIHNGGYITREFAKKHNLDSKKIGQLINLDSEQAVKLFSLVWRFSLRVYTNSIKRLE